MQVTYQVGEGNRILLAWVFDSTGRMTNGTINAWNLFLNGKVTHPDGPGKLDWLIIRQKETRDSKDKVKMPYLFNLNTRERYPFKDGIMIEAIDVVMEWLGL